MTKSTLFFGRLLLLTAACNLPELGAKPLAASMPEPPLVAYLHGGKLFCLRVQERDGESNQPLKPMELWQAKLTLKGSFKKEKQLIHVTTAYERLPDRWRVSHGYFWWQEDHTSQDAGSGDVVELTRIPLEKVSIPFADPRLNALEWEWDLPLAPVYYVRIAAGAAKKDVYFDLIPDSKDELHLLVAWHGEIRIWRGGIRWRDRDKDPQFKEQKDMPKRLPGIKWDNDKRPNLRVRTDMREAFLAYQDKTHYFLVTVSGKLYACRKDAENQRTELLWNDAHSPIRTVIHDTASQKTFAFTKATGRAEKEGRDVCFELASKLEPHAYNPKKIPAWVPADPLPTMMEYARTLFWNVPPSGWRVPSTELSAQQRQQWWADLSSTEMAKSHRAVWNLMAQADGTLVFLKERVRPVPVDTQKHLDQLLADLDSDSFDRREAATRELSRGVVAESVLQKALANRPSLERRRRLEAILEDLPDWRTKNPELLRSVRAIWVLQQIGTPEARAVLGKLTAGASSSLQTQKAKDALQSLDRLKKR